MVGKQKTEDLGIKPEVEIKVGTVSISAEVVETSSELERGLSGKPFLAENAGMYFDLGNRKISSFWMKDMKFPIDIIWIDGGEIVGIVENAPVPTETIPRFTSPKPVTHVLEVSAGFSDEHNLKIGDKVEIIE